MQTTELPPAAGDQPPPPPPQQGPRSTGETFDRVTTQLRTLRRSRSERVVAGVCGGVARSLGLDPVLVRVLVAVLAVIGGAGFVLYALGWLLLAEDDGRPSVAERAATRTSYPGAGRPLLLAVFLLVVTVLAVSDVVDSWDGLVLLLLAVAALVLWIDRRGPAPVPTDGPGQAASAPTGPSAYGSTGYGPPESWAPAPATYGAPAPRRPRSLLLLAGTLSTALLALGVLAAVDASGTDVPGAAYPALALAVVGAGLVLGAWFGRSRGLILIGVVLALATGAAAGADRVGGFGGDRVDLVLRPVTTAELPSDVEYRVGQVTYDLTAVDLTGGPAGSPVDMKVSMGVGQLVVIVPRGVDVTVEADAGVGDLRLFGRNDSGLGNTRTVTDLGDDGPGGGQLDLSVSTGVGSLEVRRG